MPLQEPHINTHILNNIEHMPVYNMSNINNINSYSHLNNSSNNIRINVKALNRVIRSRHTYNYNFVYKS